MITRISNTATRDEIERETRICFRYAHMYRPQMVIDGKLESTISIITSESPNLINMAIWGILPPDYPGDWKEFQAVQNSLSTDIATVDKTHWLNYSFKHRRCVILVTGFFNYILRDKKLIPVFVTQPPNIVLRLAGVYNITDDGFITCSILVKKTNPFYLKTSFEPYVPFLLSATEQEDWLGNGSTAEKKIKNLMHLAAVTLKQEIGEPLP